MKLLKKGFVGLGILAGVFLVADERVRASGNRLDEMTSVIRPAPLGACRRWMEDDYREVVEDWNRVAPALLKALNTLDALPVAGDESIQLQKDLTAEIEAFRVKLRNMKEQLNEIEIQSMSVGGRNECSSAQLAQMDRQLTPLTERIEALLEITIQ